MAILLTNSYQQISQINLTYGQVKTYAKYSSQSKENNKTYYDLKTTYTTGQNTLSTSSASNNLDGSVKNYGYTTFYKGETTLQEVSREITHNQDGTSPTKNVYTSWTASFGGSGNASADIVFPRIQRYPQITSVTNFTDEGNPTMTFTTISGFANARYYACLSLTGYTEDVPYREISIEDGSYTFELTEQERETLRNATPTSNTLNVIYFLRTTVNENNYYSSATGVMTIINGNPTFTYTLEETNAKVISALGTDVADDIVQDVSQVLIDVSPTALKGSSIAEVRLINRSSEDVKNVILNQSPYSSTINCIGNIFQIIVTDTRGNSSNVLITKNLIAYKKIKINSFSFERDNPTSSDIILNLDSVYKQTTGVSNTPVVKWKLDEGSYTTIPSSNYVIDSTNDKLTINNYELSNALVYTSSGKFYILIEDLFTSDSNNVDVTKGIPTFDYGEHDLQVNGDLYIADTDRENAINVKNGLIQEIGGSSTGYYVKFVNGILICYGEESYTSLNCVGFGSALYRSASITFNNFPVEFKAVPDITYSVKNMTPNTNGAVINTTSFATITSPGKVSVVKENNTAISGKVSYFAIGKWK